MHHELQIDHSTEHEPLATVPEALAPSVLSEDLALSHLNNRDITADAIEKITQSAGIMKSRKVRMALAAHPRTPRRIALRVIRDLYTFELMQLALLPGTAGDLRRVADEFLLSRLSSITRHILGMFHGVPGARAFRRHLATESVKPGAGVEVLMTALAFVADIETTHTAA